MINYSLRIQTIMYTLSITLVLCIAATAYGFPGTQIVGGEDAPAGKFPYQVSLRKNGDHLCGGSIMNARYILTAAHCFMGQTPSSITVHAGTNLLNKSGTVYAVEKVAIHPDYDTYFNDVAVIRVNKPISFNANVAPIALATKDVPEGSACTLTGWGTLQLGGSVPNNLQYISLRVESQAQCKQTHRNLRDSHICTFTKYGEGACHGDSGGPLVSNGMQIGIVSFGRPCGVGYPDVYTRITYFLPWIKAQETLLLDEEEQQHESFVA